MLVSGNRPCMTRHSQRLDDASGELFGDVAMSSECFLLGVANHSARLHHPVLAKTTLFHRRFPHDGALWGSPSTEAGNFSVLENGVIEEVPLSQMESGFYSHYLLVPKKNGGLHLILDTQRVQFQDVKAEAEIWTIGSYCPITGVSSWSSGRPQAEDKPSEQCCCQGSRHLFWVWTCILTMQACLSPVQSLRLCLRGGWFT